MRLLTIVLLLTSCGWMRTGRAQTRPAPVAITNVTVLPMSRPGLLPGQTVLIEQGQIRKIGPAGKVKIPANAVVVDGRGRYLLPGLVDMHAHLPGAEGTRHALADYFALNLASGVTGLRSMRGDASHLRWRDSLRRNASPAPHLYLATPFFTRRPYAASRALPLLRRYQASGYDFVKYLGGMTATQYDSLLADARRVGLKVAGHAPRSGLRGAVAARMASIEHIEAFAEAYQRDSLEFKQLAAQMAANRLFTCPDLFWYKATGLQYSLDRLQHQPGIAYVAPGLRREWQAWGEAEAQLLLPGGVPTAAHAQLAATLHAYRQAFRLMHAAGVQFLVSPGDGPYVVPGFGMAQELELLVGHGLSPYEALRAATYNAAAWFGETARRGTVEPGKAADLVLLDANPLENIASVRRVHGVVLAGRWLPASQLLPAKPAAPPAGR